jgi:hypothetical protein
MTAMVRALGAETLKMKRTLALWLSLIAPFSIVALNFLTAFQRLDYVRQAESAWLEAVDQTMIFWALLMWPLFITLETALVSGLEHGSDHWKHLFALPVPRGAVYAAKQIVNMGLLGLSLLALVGFTVLAGLALKVIEPGLGFEAPIPWDEMWKQAGIIYLGSWLIISLHTWVSMRWRNFVVAVGFGIVMTVSGVIIMNADWATFYPWALPGFAINNLHKGSTPMAEVLFGCVGGMVVALLGGWEFTRRDVL